MPGKLQGKVAIVTGASKGIGASIAQHLAREGASVVVNYNSDQAGAERVVSQITSDGGRAVAVRANMASETDVLRLFDATKRALGRLDVLVNNAGVYEFKLLDHVTPEHFHKHFDINVLGVLLATREAAKMFGPEGGSVINISSLAAVAAPPSTSVYSATKGAVNAITRSLSQELGKRNIRVNAINPGMIETEGVRSAGLDQGDFRKFVEMSTPLPRVGQPDDIGPAAVFFASDDSKFITGETLYITGGMR